MTPTTARLATTQGYPSTVLFRGYPTIIAKPPLNLLYTRESSSVLIMKFGAICLKEIEFLFERLRDTLDGRIMLIGLYWDYGNGMIRRVVVKRILIFCTRCIIFCLAYLSIVIGINTSIVFGRDSRVVTPSDLILSNRVSFSCSQPSEKCWMISTEYSPFKSRPIEKNFTPFVNFSLFRSFW